MDIKCIPTKLLYYDWASNYRVWSCRPTDVPSGFTLNKYHSFTIAGNNLDMLSQDNETAVSVEPDASSKYPASYKLITLTGIKYDKAFTVDPEDEYGMLCSFMTSSQADNVHTAYPNFIQLVLNNQEDTIDTKTIYNVGKKRLAEYIEAIRRNCKTILIGAVCRKWGITSKEAMTQMASMFPNPNALEQAFAMEPYKVLVQVGGLKFSKADEVILNIMPEQEASQERCLYSCLDILEENETTGCSKIGTDELKWFVANATPECAECFEWAVEQAEYIHLTEDKLWCALTQTYADEALIADNICERLNRPVEEAKMDWEPFKTVDGFEMTDEQCRVLQLVNESNVVMMNGPAGSGKSSAIKALVRMLEANHHSYTLLAPTGTAAKRLKESTGRKAYTLHLLCKKEMDYGDYIIIDESSMLSISTLAMLLKYIGFAPHLILICDEAQLASIGAGNIVQDLINSYRVPIANLTKIFRYNTSGLITLATDARTGVVDHFEETYPDYTYVPIGSDPLEQIMEQYTGLLNNGYSPNDILILSPYNIGKFGTLAINQTIQERCNSHSDSGVSYNRMLKRGKVNVAFKVGDRILNTHNEYSMPLYSEDEKEPDEEDNPEGDEVPTVPVMNGEIGVVRKAWIDAQTEPHVVAQFDENLVEINKDTLQQMLLGYAISIHKSQGQQAKAVIVVLDKSQARMVSRNLLYVGLSRAQERLVLVGSLEAIEAGLEVVENQDRDTMLCEMVMKGVEMNESI